MAKHAIEFETWQKMAHNAMAALDADNMEQVREFVETLVKKQGGGTKVWRKTHILADGALAAMEVGDLKRLRQHLEALLAVTAHGQG
jgi:hypothetical protein